MSLLRPRPRTTESTPEPEVTVVTIPRSRRRSAGPDLAAQRRSRSQQSLSKANNGADSRPHGWGRADDPTSEANPKPGFFDRRRADGTPLLLFTVLAVLTGVGLARVQSRIEILQLANEITDLSEDHQRLLDRKRRIETERAYLRRPARISEQARERLGMDSAPPERIQRIELIPAKVADPVVEGAKP